MSLSRLIDAVAGGNALQNKVGADETGSACNQNRLSHWLTSRNFYGLGPLNSYFECGARARFAAACRANDGAQCIKITWHAAGSV